MAGEGKTAEELETADGISEDTLMKGITKLEDLAKSVTEEKGKSTIEKSFADEAKSNSDEIKKGVEVSDFLQHLVEETGDYMDSMSEKINKSMEIQNELFSGLIDVVKGFGEEIKGLKETIAAYEDAPAAGGAKAIRKGIQRFEKEGEDNLTKSQISDRLVGLISKGKARTADMLVFETTGRLRPEIEKAIKEVE